MKKYHNDSLFSCDVCSRQFLKEDSLHFHQDVCHEEVDYGVAKPYKCQEGFCQKVFRKESFLSKHSKFHITLGKKTASEEESSLTEKQSPCSVCGILFSQAKMWYHLNTHAEGKPKCNCKDCGKEFSNKSKLKLHKLAVHDKVKFSCPYESCAKVFTRREALRQHIKGIHTNREINKCNMCSKSYSQKFDLQEHVRAVHEGRKHYCSICKKDFVRSSERNRHERQVHGVQKSGPK